MASRSNDKNKSKAEGTKVHESDYGYGDDALPGKPKQEVKRVGDQDVQNAVAMYGYEETDYGYGEQHQPIDYGYGDDKCEEVVNSSPKPRPCRQRSRRRNSCLVRKEQNPLAVAEYLMGGPPRMSDRDLNSNLVEMKQVTA